MQQHCEYMYTFCPECHLKLLNSGISASLYHSICEFKIAHNEPTSLYTPYFEEVIRYLEINGYITTTECSEDTVFARPNMIALDDNETVVFCSGNCTANVIEFDTGTE